MTRCWHITIATTTRETAFRDEPLHRAAVRKLTQIAGRVLGLFGVVDNHVHLLPVIPRGIGGRLVQRINCSLADLTGMRMAEADYEPVRRQDHLRTLVRYFLRQPVHHGLPYHPALWAGSCFQDLVGARWLPGLRLRIAQELPRLRLGELLRHVGLPTDRPIEPADAEVLRRVGPARIAAAASSAIALPANQGKKAPLTLLGRRIAVALAREAGFTRAAIADALGWPVRNISRDMRRAPAPGAVLATRIRVALEEAVARSTSARSPTPR